MMVKAGAIASSPRKADIIVFSGGVDVCPYMYGEAGYHPLTQKSDLSRDRFEAAAYFTAMAKKKLIVGVCRGAQLVNVLNGGKLWQNADGHRNTAHMVTYIDEKGKKSFPAVTSDHHQIMIPTQQASIWAYAGKSTIKSSFEDDIPMVSNHNDDPEVIFYPRTRTLCFQPHPEWGLVECERLFYDCIKRAA
jgi:gamma-glutamyl-gamma-aminobutyrate hydrolase PuuD